MNALEILITIIILQRLSELALSRRNQRWAMERGGIESGQGHYWMFFVLHTGWLVGTIAEAVQRGGAMIDGWIVPLSGFVVAQVLRYWAISTLGRQWNTRIIVIPGMPRVESGPYRWFTHPNYVAVVLELACVPAIFGAWITLITATVVNLVILLTIRIPAEEQALQQSEKPRQKN